MKKRIAGFTLIELMMAVVVAAILLSVGIPNLTNILAKGRVQGHQRDVLAHLNFARSEAVTRNEAVGICGSSNGTSCAGSNNWSAGWIVFVDDGAGTGTRADGVINGSEEVIRIYDYDGSNRLVVTDDASPVNAINGFAYSARGYLASTSGKLTLKICESGNDLDYARAVLVEQTGRATNSYDLNTDDVFEDVNGNNLACP